MSARPIYNFSAGPAVLPEAVLRTAQQEMLDYNGTGFPVMAMSHRSEMFLSILHHAEQDLRTLLNIPSNYKILFLQGGATTQFNMVAMNLAHGFPSADAVVTGNWSRIAYEQMSRLTDAEIRLAAHGGEQFDYTALPPVETWDIDKTPPSSTSSSTRPSTACNTKPFPNFQTTCRRSFAICPAKSSRANLTFPTTV